MKTSIILAAYQAFNTAIEDPLVSLPVLLAIVGVVWIISKLIKEII